MRLGTRRRGGTGPSGRRSLAADTLLALVVLGLLGAVALRWNRHETINLQGRAEVADGDTLNLSGQRLRLRGVDAPEIGQTCRRPAGPYDCGRSARDALRALVGGARTVCEGSERDRYQRLLVRCSVRGIDVGERLVRDGWAVAYGDYTAEEGEARRAARGLWAGSFDRPRHWRETHGGLAELPHELTGAFAAWWRWLLH